MRKFFISLFLMQGLVCANSQIVADHSAVKRFDDIPQQYIDSVKQLLVSMPGESHATVYRLGMQLLMERDNTYGVDTYNSSNPPGPTDQNLRIGNHRFAGEDFFFSQDRMADMREDISDQNATGNPFHLMGFGWCYDMTNDNDPGGLVDTVFQVRWAGRSIGAPDGNRRWGLDSGDEALTGNSVSMDTYLEAVESYIVYCEENSYPTMWIFTTGPVDSHEGTENGFQREIKHDYIRDYVNGHRDRILFDYADILCWNNNNEKYEAEWNDEGTIRLHAQIHPDNMMDYNSSWNLVPHTEDGDHIGEVGALRLARAMWWLLARLSGWEDKVPVDTITVYTDSLAVISESGGSLQMRYAIAPENADIQSVSWSVFNGTGAASIDSSGMLRAVSDGTVMVRATAEDSSGVYGELEVTILNQLIPVTDIVIHSEGDSLIDVDKGVLQMYASILPDNATDTTVLWSVINGTGMATIDSSGMLMAKSNGLVRVRATANDSSGIFGELPVTITNQFVPVTEILISSEGGETELNPNDSTLQLYAAVLPSDASNNTLTWSIINGSGTASIDSTGLVRAQSEGSVTARATANDGSGIFADFGMNIVTPPDTLDLGVHPDNPRIVYEGISSYDLRLAVQVTMPESGDIHSISIYHQGGGGDFLLGVYADESGLPGPRLGVTPVTRVSSSEGWQEVDLSVPARVEGGEVLWLAWVFEDNPGIRYASGTPARASSSEGWSGGMPEEFGPSGQSNFVYSIVTSYTQALKAGPLTANDTDTEEGISIYPNPTRGEVTMALTRDNPSGYLLTIYSSSGRIMKQMEMEPNEKEIQFSIAEYPQGMYILTLTDASTGHRENIVKLLKIN